MYLFEEFMYLKIKHKQITKKMSVVKYNSLKNIDESWMQMKHLLTLVIMIIKW